MQLRGELDASNYQDVIAKAKEVFDGGARNLLLDLGDLSFMASSGLVALHSVALIMRGDDPPDPEHGWGAFRTIDREKESGLEEHCKILNPQPPVDKALQLTGFKAYLQVYTDLDAALASF